MAYIFRIPGDKRVCIQSALDIPSGQFDYAILIASSSFILPGAFKHEGLVIFPNDYFALERALLRCQQDIPQFLVIERQSGQVILTDPIGFAPSFFLPFFDLAKNTNMPPFALCGYRKPELLAVFTHVYNDLDALEMWQQHYARLVPHRHLYVIDHGSTSPLTHILNSDVSVVSIPRGEIDHFNISQFCSYFQRFLLTQYRWVIHVDSDELVVHRHGPAALLERLDSDSEYGPIVRAAQSFELLDHTAGRSPIDRTTPLSLQRHLLNEAPAYRKPVLGAMPTSWTIGFHQALEDQYILDDPNLWLIHTRYADLQRAARRERIWTDAPQSLSAQTFTPQHERCESMEELVAKIERQFSDRRSVMPDWMRGTF